LTDDPYPDGFLAFDECAIEKIDQDVPLSRIERVLPELDDRAARLRRLRPE